MKKLNDMDDLIFAECAKVLIIAIFAGAGYLSFAWVATIIFFIALIQSAAIYRKETSIYK